MPKTRVQSQHQVPQNQQVIDWDALISHITFSLTTTSNTFINEIQSLQQLGTHTLPVRIIIAALLKKNISTDRFKHIVTSIHTDFENSRIELQINANYMISLFRKLVNTDHLKLNELFSSSVLKQSLDLIVQKNYYSIFKVFVKLMDLSTIEDCLLKGQTKDGECFVRVGNSKYINFIYYLIRNNDQTVSAVYIDDYHQQFNLLLQNRVRLSTDNDNGNNDNQYGVSNYEDVVDYLLDNRFEEILIQLYLYGKKYIEINQKVLIKLYQNDFVIFLELFGNFSQNNRSLFLKAEFFRTMMEKEQTKKQFMFQLELLLKLSQNNCRVLKDSQQHQLIMKYQELIENPEYLEYVYINQLYVVCMIYILLTSLISKWNEWNIKLNKLREDYMDIIKQIIDKIDDDYTLKVVMFYPHIELDNKALITFIQEYSQHFIDILNNHKISNVISCQWKGNKLAYFNFMNETYLYQRLINPTIKLHNQSSKSDRVTDQHLEGHDLQKQIHKLNQIIQNAEPKQKNAANKPTIVKNYDQQQQSYNIIGILNSDINKEQMTIWKKQNFFYQFDVYNENFQIRRVLDFISIILLFIAFFYIIETRLITLSTTYQSWNNDYTQIFEYKIPSKYASNITLNVEQMNILNQEQETRNSPQFFMNYCNSLFNKVYQFSSTSSSLKSTLQSYCTKFENFTIFIWGYNTFFQLVFFLTFNLVFKSVVKIIYAYLIKSDRNASGTIIVDILVMITCIYLMVQAENITKLNSVSTTQLYFYQNLRDGSILILISLYLMLVSATETFKGIGFQVLILKSIMKKIAYFLVFYMTIVIAISVIFYIMFGTLDSSVYGSLNSTFLVIFSNPLGTYTSISDSTSYSTAKSIKVYIHNMMAVAFQFYMMVVFLNVVIAILNTAYEKMAENSRKEYSLVIYHDYTTYKPSLYLSAIINTPDILSVFGLVICPILYYTRSRRLNRVFNIIWYSIYMLALFIPIHCVLNLLLIPIVYLKTLMQLLCMDYKDRFDQYSNIQVQIRILYFLTYLVFGLLHLIYQYIVDTIHLLCKLFKPVHQRHYFTFQPHTYKLFKQTINQFTHNQQVSLHDFQSAFQKQTQHYHNQQQNLCLNLDHHNLSPIICQKMHRIFKRDQIQLHILQSYLEDIKVRQLYLDQKQKYEYKLQQLEIIFARQTIENRCQSKCSSV